MAIQQLSPIAPAELAPPSRAEGAAAVAVTRSARLDLTLTTRDGDTVTISSANSDTTVAAAAQDHDGTATGFLRSTSSSVSIEVHGSLDREELADLQKALKALAHAARRGDVEKLQRRLAHAHLDSVASLSASVGRSVQVIGGVLTLPPESVQPAAADAATSAAAA